MQTINENQAEATKNKRLTIEDIKSVIESNGLDPLTVGPTKIRAITKSGSLTTISNHLNAIRLEIHNKNAIASNIEAAPPVPVQLAQQIYDLAYQNAFIQIQRAFGALSIENQALKANFETIKLELSEILEFSDTQSDLIEQKNTEMQALENSIKAIQEQHQESIKELENTAKLDIEKINHKLDDKEKELKDLQHTYELSILKAETQQKALNDMYQQAQKELDQERKNAENIKAMFEQLTKKGESVKKDR